MIRTKGEAGTGDIVNAVTHCGRSSARSSTIGAMREDETHSDAKNCAPDELVKWVAENGRLPVVTFTAGGIATPADAALCMQLGADGVFVGSRIFKSGRDPLLDRDGWIPRASRAARGRSSRRRRTSRRQGARRRLHGPRTADGRDLLLPSRPSGSKCGW